jgi:hypothetical protein
MMGSFGDDRITGSNKTDIIIGLLGADILRGGTSAINCMEEKEMIYFQVAWEIIFLMENKEMTNCMEAPRMIYCKGEVVLIILIAGKD